MALAITQAQEAGWSEVADAVRENAAQTDELVKKKQSGVTNMTAVKNFGPSDTKPPSQG